MQMFTLSKNFAHLNIINKVIYFKFEVREYMDMYPRKQIISFQNEADAREWANQMTKNYSGGPTVFIGKATDEEIASELAKNLVYWAKELDYAKSTVHTSYPTVKECQEKLKECTGLVETVAKEIGKTAVITSKKQRDCNRPIEYKVEFK